jgi:diguanylate cyclase (GGDEF)-like protein
MERVFDELLEATEGLWKEIEPTKLVERFFEIGRNRGWFAEVGRISVHKKGGTPVWDGESTSLPKSLDSVVSHVKIYHGSSQGLAQGYHSFEAIGEKFFAVTVPKSPEESLYLIGKFQRTLTRRDEELLYFISVQLQRLFNCANKLSDTQAQLYQDDLTGLFNYRYLHIALDSEVKRVQRFQTTFCLMFLDVDNLKPINDEYGHLAGTQVLKQVAEVLKQELREVDSVFRYGGDEFVALLLEASPSTGKMTGERLRRRIESTEFRIEGGKVVRLTASIGISCCPENSLDKATLLKLADDCMYKSKHSGKNRVSVAGIDLVEPSVSNRVW